MPTRRTVRTDLSGITLLDGVSETTWDLGALHGTWLLSAIRHHR